MTTEYITITCHVSDGDRDGFRVEHRWDGQRFSLKASAVRNGFNLTGTDDFRVGVLENGKLTSVRIWWLEEQASEEPETLAAIAKEIGLVKKIDTANVQFVGRQGDDVIIAMPRARMTRQQALVHAAWLVLVADCDGSEFSGYLEAVGCGE